MTPADLRALAAQATEYRTGPTWFDNDAEGMAALEHRVTVLRTQDALVKALAPQLAVLCADLADKLESLVVYSENRARLVVYHGKGDKDRIVPLPLQAMQAVNELDLLYGLDADDYVWTVIRAPKNQTSWWRRKPVGDTTFERWYRNALEALGVRYLNPHQTRHTYGQMLREHDYDIEERQVLMGHESIKTTQKYYGRVTVEDVARKMTEVGL